ncbi:hypothetical protein KIPB_015182, partial [Kipferlia bialata]|eukprot:g15182.t1
MSGTGGAYGYTNAHSAHEEALTLQECEVEAPEIGDEDASAVAISPYGILLREDLGMGLLLDGSRLDEDGTLKVEGVVRKCKELCDRHSHEAEPVVCIGDRVVTFHSSRSPTVCVYNPTLDLVEKREGKNTTWTTKYIGTDGVTYPLLGGLTLDAPDLQKPGLCPLEGRLMLFGGSRYPDGDTRHKDLTPNHHAYLYDVDTDEWTK